MEITSWRKPCAFVWWSQSYGRSFPVLEFPGASFPDVDHGDNTSFKGILAVYFIFCICLDLLVDHHHCWKCTRFLMFRVSMFNGIYSMKIINLKDRKQQGHVQFCLFLVLVCLSLPPPLSYMCMFCVPCPIPLKIANSWQFEGRQKGHLLYVVAFFWCLVIMLIQILWSLSSLTPWKRFWLCGCLSNFHHLINLNNSQTLLLVLWSPKLYSLKYFSTVTSFWPSLWRWWKLSL